ncbi:hypothetical protein [Streptomyces sp. NBC_00503]|uniref:hypothetical protein n=1 Tax=Streptomyces sp. NBC_00503 TaxID=2903659 RepID=UPI002E819374|nr:hypothetical protein [Streptomyces sp. NBC_00503]WUD84437.1 hypothetical protein OG490_29910 [Streptomyces sp. NBC_00503]
MTGLRTAAAAAALLGPLLLATGCGIATTGVVESGGAGTMNVGGPQSALVYFLSPEGALRPVTVTDLPQTSVSATLATLLNGPNDTARAAGLTTELPAPDSKGFAEGVIKFGVGDNGKDVRVVLPFPIAPLSALARRQVACTVDSAVSRTPEPEILLVGSEGKQERVACGIHD